MESLKKRANSLPKSTGCINAQGQCDLNQGLASRGQHRSKSVGFVFRPELGPVLKSDVQSRDQEPKQLQPKSYLLATHCPCSGSQLTHDMLYGPTGTDLIEGFLEISCCLLVIKG